MTALAAAIAWPDLRRVAVRARHRFYCRWLPARLGIHPPPPVHDARWQLWCATCRRPLKELER